MGRVNRLRCGVRCTDVDTEFPQLSINKTKGGADDYWQVSEELLNI